MACPIAGAAVGVVVVSRWEPHVSNGRIIAMALAMRSRYSSPRSGRPFSSQRRCGSAPECSRRSCCPYSRPSRW